MLLNPGDGGEAPGTIPVVSPLVVYVSACLSSAQPWIRWT